MEAMEACRETRNHRFTPFMAFPLHRLRRSLRCLALRHGVSEEGASQLVHLVFGRPVGMVWQRGGADYAVQKCLCHVTEHGRRVAPPAGRAAFADALSVFLDGLRFRCKWFHFPEKALEDDEEDEEGEEEAIESVIGALRSSVDEKRQDLYGDSVGHKMIEAIKAVEAGMQANDLELYQAVIGNAKTITVADEELREKFGRIKVLPGKESRVRVDLLQKFLNDAIAKSDET